MITESYIENLLAYMNLGQDSKDKIPELNRFKLAMAGSVIPFAESSIGKHSQDVEDRLFMQEYHPKLIKKRLDISLLVESADPMDNGLFGIRRIEKLNISALRGQKIYSEYALTESSGLLKNSGEFIGHKAIYNYNPITKGWQQLALNGWMRDSKTDITTYNFLLSMALQEFAYTDHFWHVTLGYENGLRLKLRTDEEGSKEVFRLRDLPEGRARRTALKHWVSGHYRTRPKQTKVKSFLRGAEEFVWNNLYYKIEPPLAILHELYPNQYQQPEQMPTIYHGN